MKRQTWLYLLLGFGTVGGAARADEPDQAAARTFFEAKVRPILVERCQTCHGPEPAKGGLRLDTRAGMLAGGDSGPVVVAGQPAASLLVEAIGHAGDIQMPPKSKLPAAEIATLTRWVETGAFWPVDRAEPAGLAASSVQPFNLADRAQHWSWQPITSGPPPEVRDSSWPANAVDRFILAKLEAAGLAPARDADRGTLIRRASFDLIGLPPRPDQVAAFLADPAPIDQAFARVVDRLLASPHYGERWARHWMDLVRFAETSGHEFDYEIPLAHRYRDYLIRAFNQDLPFDQFVVEHVAGDLLADPRRDPMTGQNESVLATGFFRLHEGVHSPVDLRDDRVTRVDNQVDVLSKAFLGLTIACARCHDHKFDAITTADYYALTGFLTSSRHTLAVLDPADRNAPALAELAEIRRQVSLIVGTAAPNLPTPPAAGAAFATFDDPTYAGWFVTGDAFGAGPTQPGAVRVEGDQVVAIPPGVADSGAISPRLRGVIRSRTFPISQPSIQVLAAGQGGRINVVIEGFEKIRAPIYGDLVVDVNHGPAWRWVTINVAPWIGLPAYLEIDDGLTVDFTANRGTIQPGDGSIAVAEIRFGSGPPPPNPVEPARDPRSPAQLAALAPLIARYHAVENRLAEPTLGQALTDGTGIDARILIRGNPRNLGPTVPRRFLEVLGGSLAASPGSGSGRLALAHAIADPRNPLTARVVVNRLWHHHFGRGIVASVDDFGAMGQPPTHPELLDYLAARFIASGWSIKSLQRDLVLARTYRMSSQPTPDADQADPGNTLLHRRTLARLDAGSIRDAILAVSGQLDPTLGGPSVPPHLTPFMDGRGRPSQSGPLDGDGRRSIYLNVRRNFLTPMLLAFDFPTPSLPMGRRTTSNVPAQALTLLNDPFVIDQAHHWARRILTDHPEATTNPAPAIQSMYQTAFGHPPSPTDQATATRFLDEAKSEVDSLDAWTDLAHALFNVKEFVTVPNGVKLSFNCLCDQPFT